MSKPKEKKKGLRFGELYAYLIEGGRKNDKVLRVKSEGVLQDIIRNHTKQIFRKSIEWISQKGAYGDMFGLSEDKRLIVVEIKGLKSKGKKKAGYALSQIRRRVRRIKEILSVKSKHRFIEICKKYGIKNPQERFKKKLGLDFKKLRFIRPDFYLISTQLPKKVIEEAVRIRRKYRIKRWTVKIQCLNINVLKRSGKKFLIIMRYL